MATITINARPQNNVGSTPWGNAHALRYRLDTASNGAAFAASSGAPIQSGDKVRLGLIPAGSELLDCYTIVSDGIDGFTAQIGFEYADGVDDAKAPQAVDYFNAGADFKNPARINSPSAKAPVVLQKDAWLILTATAGATGAGRADIVVLAAATGRL